MNAALPLASIRLEPDATRWRHGFAAALARPADAPDDWIDPYTRLEATPLPEPYLVSASDDFAATLGVDRDALAHDPWLSALAGNAMLPGAEPLAAVYSGHQFGVYVPQLGDGRALLLGGYTAADDGSVWELQLKGAGRTPYSRMGDGRAVLRSSIREFLCSEAMDALGIPTTRALAVIGSPQPVVRETVETAAVATRASPSFVRFGSFEFYYWTGRHAQLKLLADYVIETFYPQCRDANGHDPAQPYLALLREASLRTARLIAGWQAVGFCHGVMNSDNMSILGLTIDYGPFGFLDGFDLKHICNHSDEQGRYAYDMQPKIGHWNLYCLGQALVPLTGDPDATKDAIDAYLPEFERAMNERMRAKLGLATAQPTDAVLVERLIEMLHAQRVDWTIFWRRLAGTGAPVRDLFVDRDAFDAWQDGYRQRLAAENSIDGERATRMNRVNPRIVLRNHLAEAAIRKARGVEGDPHGGPRDFGEVDRLLRALRRPYEDIAEFDDYAALPPEWAAQLHLSCSS